MLVKPFYTWKKPTGIYLYVLILKTWDISINNIRNDKLTQMFREGKPYYLDLP